MYVKRYKTMYMHTIDGRPAAFSPGGKYLYHCSNRTQVMLVPTLRRLRREQAISRENSMLARAGASTYGYTLVAVPLDV